MSLFTNAQRVAVNGGQLTAITNNNNTYLSGPTGIDILCEASAPEAAHDSSARSYSARCFPGTREQYIEDIVRRAIPSLGDTPLPIYWMRGPAGVGKSAIAQTCAEELQRKGALGAAFFFSVSGQRMSEKLFPSIAYQLSTIHPAYCDLIDQKLRRDKTIVGKAMRFQYQYLIDEPLRELEENGRGIRNGVQVFVDGLDECEGADAQCEIIRIVAAAVSNGVIPLRWAFFSRPEPHIETMISRTSVSPYCYKTILPISRDADGEIELYLRNCFDNILPSHNTSTDAPWPSAEEMETIVAAAGGLFIYAITVVRFVSRLDSLSPQKRLLAIIDVILHRRSRAGTSNDAPFAELDAFYILILQRIPMEVFPSVHLLLAILCRYWKPGATVVANLLRSSKDDFETICNHVSAVTHFEDPGKDLELDPTIDTSCAYTQTSQEVANEVFLQICLHLGGQISFYHKSFNDFLLDPVRSGSYCVKASEAMSKHFVKIHLDYDRSFCWRGSDLVLAPGVPDSAASLSYPYTNEFVNSILKTYVYTLVGHEDPDSFPAPPAVEGLDADCDFRKYLHIYTNFGVRGSPYCHLICGCVSQRKEFPGIFIDYVSHNSFPRFNVVEFKSVVKQQERENVIRRYHPNLTSRIKSLFRNKSKEGFESGLYHTGHREKSIFWYWEINHKLQYYRSFHAIDLAEGEKRFREADFDSWPGYGDEDEDEDEDGNEEGGRNENRNEEGDKNENTNEEGNTTRNEGGS